VVLALVDDTFSNPEFLELFRLFFPYTYFNTCAQKRKEKNLVIGAFFLRLVFNLGDTESVRAALERFLPRAAPWVFLLRFSISWNAITFFFFFFFFFFVCVCVCVLLFDAVPQHHPQF
jgi:hypothetical protein